MKQPIYFEYDLNSKNGPAPLVAVAHTDDRANDVIRLHLLQNGAAVDITGTAVTARYVMRRTRELLSDDVPCAVAGGDILIPFDNEVIASRAGDMHIEVNITDRNGELTLQFPLTVRVNGSILETAEISSESEGTIPALLREARDELARVSAFSDGASAYEIAVRNGYNGPEQDWLASLKGDRGDAYLLTDEDKQAIAGMVEVSGKADAAATLAGYGITDAYTRTQTDGFLATKADGEVCVYNSSGDEPYTSCGDAEAQNNIKVHLFGGNAGTHRTGVPGLTAADTGMRWRITVTFVNAGLSDRFVLEERTQAGTTRTVTEWTNVREGDVKTVFYTMSDATVRVLRLQFNERIPQSAEDCNRLNVRIDRLPTRLYAVDEADAFLAAKADADPLPAYCISEIERVKTAVLSQADYGDVVFGLFTDLHFGNLGVNAADDAQKWNAIRSMRRLADECGLDFVLQGGDLLTQNTYDNDTYILNRSQYEFAGCRAPLYTAKGDHDSSQRKRHTNDPEEPKISTSDFAKRTAPYMPRAVRSAAYPNNYYFDLPEKKTRVICIDTGTIMAGQSGADYTSWTGITLYRWLLDEVLTEDVKSGWKFIIFTHAPCDPEWQFGAAKMFRTTSPGNTTSSLNYAKGSMLLLHRLMTAINSNGVFSTEFPTNAGLTTKYRCELSDNSDGILSTITNVDRAIGGDVYAIYPIYEDGTITPYVTTKDFSGWSSKARMILSGHCHCDRLNNSTLVPDGNGNYERGDVSYAIAYTGAAQKAGFKDDLIDGSLYYNYCFGSNAVMENGVKTGGAEGAVSYTENGNDITFHNAAWSHLRDRAYGDISEQLMDVWIVGDEKIARVRFGAGADSPLLATNLNVCAYDTAVANGYQGTKAEWLASLKDNTNNYALTLANLAISLIPTTEGVNYGN